jgi:hypothetical protein
MNRRVLFAAAAATLLGCDSQPPSTLEPITSASLRLDDAGVVQSANGSGHFTSGGEIRTFAFNAKKRADGSVTGQYQINAHASGIFFHVSVTCMDVVDNTAFIAGIITQASGAPVVEGTVSYFYARDAGEGPDAADIVSVARINDVAGADQEFCATHPLLLPPRAVEQGNVQVR